MTLDRFAIAAAIVGFALWLTVHVTVAFGLARRSSLGRGAAAFFALPLAPYWSWRAHMRVRTVLWCITAVLYVVGLALSCRAA